jgi:hypothetical protein
LKNTKKADEKSPSVPRRAGLPLPAGRSLFIAAYLHVRLIHQNCLPDRQVKGSPEAPAERDFAKLNLHLGIFDRPLCMKMTFLSPEDVKASNLN